MELLTYTLPLNNDEKLVFSIEENDLHQLFYDSSATIFFQSKISNTILTYDNLHDECVVLNSLLRKAMTKELIWNQSKVADIGFQYNEALYKQLHMNSQRSDQSIDQFTVWSPLFTKGTIKTWLYNDILEDIILCMTPVYPYMFLSKKAKGYVPYEQWIKTYTPFAKRVISPTIAQEWVKQTDEMISLIQKNSSRGIKNNMHGECIRPKNGQKALDNSITFKESSSTRVSVSDGEFVILIKKKSNTSYGHVVQWNELELAMQDALIDAGLVTEHGKIICKN